MAAGSVDPRAAAIAAALQPYAWRDLTESMVARRVVAAADRAVVLRLLEGIPGVDVGVLEPLEPTPDGDLRVATVARFLQRRCWRAFALGRLAGDLLAVLDDWQAEWDAFGAKTPGLLDDR